MFLVFTIALIGKLCSSNSSSSESVQPLDDNPRPSCFTPQSFYPPLSQTAKESLIDTVRFALLDSSLGHKRSDFAPQFQKHTYQTFVTLRENGQQLTQGQARTLNLERAVYQATQAAYQSAKPDLAPQKNCSSCDCEKDFSHLEIEITLIEPTRQDADNFEAGITGVEFNSSDPALASTILLSKDFLEQNYIQTTSFDKRKRLEAIYQQIIGQRLPEEQKNDLRVSNFRDFTFGTTQFTGSEIVNFYRGNSADSCSLSLTPERVQESIQLAEQWLLNNTSPRGDFRYSYYPSLDEFSPNNNFIRQFLASRYLAEIASDNSQADKLHQENLGFIFENWYQEEGQGESGVGYIYNTSRPNGSKLGANALLLRALIYSPYFDQYQDKWQRLANSILETQNPDGSFNAFYVEPPKEKQYDEDYYLTFYSGEALLTLIELYQKTGQKVYLEAAIKSQDYYLEKYANQIEENYYPAYVPWHSQSLYKIYQATEDKKYLEGILVMNDKLLELQNTSGEPYRDYLGRFFNPATPQYGWPHSASDGPYTESLYYAYRAAQELGKSDYQIKYRERLTLSLKNLLRHQFHGANMYYIQKPERARGGFKTNLHDNRLRLDNTGHGVDALLLGQKFLQNQ